MCYVLINSNCCFPLLFTLFYDNVSEIQRNVKIFTALRTWPLITDQEKFFKY